MQTPAKGRPALRPISLRPPRSPLIRLVKFTLAACVALPAFAASNTELLDFYSKSIKAQFPQAKISITGRAKVANTGFESVILTIENEGEKQEEIIFTKDELIVPDIIDLGSKISYRQDYEMKKFQAKRENFIKNAKPVAEKETMVIRLGAASKAPIYVFSDPECPFCRDYLGQLEQDLKDYQVVYILTPVHGKSAFEKAALIYRETATAKNDEEKIKILKKYYAEDLKKYPAVSEVELKKVVELYKKYRALGLSATPTVVQ